MSPEQILSRAVGSRTAVFAAGIIPYQLLTGQRPFTGDGAFDVQRKIVLEEPLPPSRLQPDLPSTLDSIVARALAKQPEHR